MSKAGRAIVTVAIVTQFIAVAALVIMAEAVYAPGVSLVP